MSLTQKAAVLYCGLSFIRL